MKSAQTKIQTLNNERGFALITAMMMLFAATILGLMVMNSSEIEILLSGAQQRYERSFNTAEGASNLESIILDNDLTHNTRKYVVTDPGNRDSIISPATYGLADFDPQTNINADPGAIDNGDPGTWPSDNIIATDNTLAYRYLIIYEKWNTPKKGYDSSTKGQMAEYYFEVDVANWNVATQSHNAWIETGNTRMGPRPN